jgi:hypothetical protein
MEPRCRIQILELHTYFRVLLLLGSSSKGWTLIPRYSVPILPVIVDVEGEFYTLQKKRNVCARAATPQKIWGWDLIGVGILIVPPNRLIFIVQENQSP